MTEPVYLPVDPMLAAPACPDWCDGSTHQATKTLDPDPNLHAQTPTYAPITLGGDGTFFALGLVRDDIVPGVPAHIGIALNDGWLIQGCPYADEAQLTPAQARELAAVLIRLADQGEGR